MTVKDKRSTLPMVTQQKSGVATNNMQRFLPFSAGFLLLVAISYTTLSMFQI